MKKFAFTLAELSLIFFIMAILAVLFYRTVKPDKIIFNHLYYAAYSQMEDAYREVRAYNDTTTEDATQKNIYTDGNFDITKYCTIFNKIVNFVGNSGVSEHYTASTEYSYSEPNECYSIETTASDLFSDGNFSTLSNGMQIRFDRFILGNAQDSDGNNPEILVATIDINGTEEPNSYNKDIIQMEINAKGIFPIGDIENNAEILKFRVSSRYNGVQNIDGAENPVSGDEHVVRQNDETANNISYEKAACLANLPRHTFYELKNTTDKCASITVLNECKYDRLPCTIDVVKP